LFLDAHARILFALSLVSTGGDILGWVERGQADGLADYLDSRKFRYQVSVEVADDLQVSWCGSGLEPYPKRQGSLNTLGGMEVFHRRGEDIAGNKASGWAYAARRIAHGIPRYGMDTDELTTPWEVPASESIALNKTCYPGHEEMARNRSSSDLRRLVRLHLDGGEERFVLGSQTPTPRVVVSASDPSTTLGFMGSYAYHYVLGPIGLALVSAHVSDDTDLLVDGVPARLEPLT
jgi:folate-binding Fe-S cluster repair protein YgfZ